MSFFDAPPPPRPKRPPRPRLQEWMGAPEGWLGGFVPVRAVLARTAEIAITLGPMEAFPTGVSLEMQITRRRWSRGPGRDSDSGMQFGVAYADGSKWQGLRQAYPLPGEGPPPEEAQKLWEPLTEEEEEAGVRAGHQRGESFSSSVRVMATKDRSRDDKK